MTATGVIRCASRAATTAAATTKPIPTFLQYRSYSSQAPTPREAPSTVSPRWLSDTKARVGKCITFGLKPEQVDEAGSIVSELGTSWRDLVAGSEGFLTDPKRAGLFRQNIVWGEQDSMGHVNNVMYVRFAESGRCNWTRNYGQYHDPKHRDAWEALLTSKGIGLILKSITVDFKFPMTWPDKISVFHKLRSRPDESTQSLVLDVMILSEAKQRPAARCLEDVVVYDYRVGKKSSLEPFMLNQFKKTFDLQEQAKKDNLAKIQQIEERVRKLEKASWDNPDAVEDMGSAAQQSA
ncbi:hypothetical protein B0A52_03696 [Exophiala mesophila]|uniref:Thioesterase domain-containing protein n=1 Tax=Exophiala mesophila TaxID=212818 RepID=A0A438N9R7_EXOME|nr:hypothetical protein B0A52_03696 [Exophiala mesophila]